MAELITFWRTWYYRVLYQTLLKRCVFGRNIKIRGSLRIKGPGRVVLGDDCIIDRGEGGRRAVVVITHSQRAFVEIYRSTIMRGTFIGCKQQIQIGPQALLEEANIIDADFHAIEPEDRQSGGMGPSDPVAIGSGVYIGHGCVVMKGVTLGAGVVVLPGTCLGKKTIRNGAVVRGCPATIQPDHEYWQRPVSHT